MRLIATLLALIAIAGVVAVRSASPRTAEAATFTVTKTADTNDGTCDVADCSLREAIIAANAAAGTDTVVVPAGTYTLSIAGASEDAAASGDLDITSNMTIQGAGANLTIIDGADLDRVFGVEGSVTAATISGVTVRNGTASFGGGIENDTSGTLTIDESIVTLNSGSFGGGINNNSVGTIVVSDTVVSNNTASSFGGGINNNSGGVATITQSTISGNTANGAGGINNNSSGSMSITQSTISGNTATSTFRGGGVHNNSSGTLNITASTISGNTSPDGAGLNNNSSGVVTITNSTISGNTGSGDGGGVYVNSSGNVTLLSTTIANNVAVSGDGIHMNSSGDAILRDTIISNPNAGADCVGNISQPLPVSQGNNLAIDATCGLTGTGDLPSTPAGIASLADNGGDTFTHALQAGSAAIDAGSGSCPATDQRGVARPIGSACDIGAFEAASTAPTATATTSAGTATATATSDGNSGGSSRTRTPTPTATATATPTSPAQPAATATRPTGDTGGVISPPDTGDGSSAQRETSLALLAGAALLMAGAGAIALGRRRA